METVIEVPPSLFDRHGSAKFVQTLNFYLLIVLILAVELFGKLFVSPAERGRVREGEGNGGIEVGQETRRSGAAD